MTYFEKDLLYHHPSILTGESTPSYMVHSDVVIERVRALCPWVKLFVILRNPTQRAYSQYQMCTDMSGTPEQRKIRGLSAYKDTSFEDVVKAEIEALGKAGITPESGYRDLWARVTGSLPMGHGGHSVVLRGLYALLLQPWIDAFPLGTSLKVLSIKDLQGTRDQVRGVMNDVYKHVGLPPHDVENIAARNTREYTPMPPEVRRILDEFYEPYNAKLEEMLGSALD
eukprot:gene824-916_t